MYEVTVALEALVHVGKELWSTIVSVPGLVVALVLFGFWSTINE